jgi:integrase
MARKRATRRAKGEGSHWFDKKNNRHIWYLELDGRRYTATDRDEERAKAKFEVLRRQVLGGIDIDGSRQLLVEWLPRFIDNEVARHSKESTVHDYHKRADYYILPTLGDYRLCDMTRRLILAWVNAMLDYRSEKGKPWSLNSIRQAHRLLERALEAAVAENYLEINPAGAVKVPRRRMGDEMKIDEEDDPAAKALTPEQQALFLAEVLRTAAQHGLYVLYVLALDLGMRRGELLGLRWKDVDFEQKVLRVRQQVVRLDGRRLVTTPKTGTSRRDLPVTDWHIALLQKQREALGERAGVKDLVFPNEQGDYREPNGITQHMRRVCARIGLEGFTPHSLRKTAITNWRRNGVDLEVAGALAGHKGVKVTAETYSDPQMDRKRAAIEKKGRASE